MTQFFDFSLSDFVFLVIKLAVAAVALRWFLGVVYENFFAGLRRSSVEQIAKDLTPPAKKPRRRPNIKHTGPKLRVEKVYHVGAPDGRLEIVMAEDADDAKKVGAASLGIEEDEAVVAEVYDKAVRR